VHGLSVRTLSCEHNILLNPLPGSIALHYYINQHPTITKTDDESLAGLQVGPKYALIDGVEIAEI